MPGDEFRQAQLGRPVLATPRAWNDMLAAQRAVKHSAHDLGANLAQALPQADVVYVQNNSGGARNQYDILAIESPIILPTANLTEFTRRVTLSGTTPDGTRLGEFVVLLDAIPSGEIGRAVVAGVALARVLVRHDNQNYGFADALGGDPSQLVMTVGGGAQILWPDFSGTIPDSGSGLWSDDVPSGDSGSGSGSGDLAYYTAWAVVRLGPPLAGNPRHTVNVVTNVCPLFTNESGIGEVMTGLRVEYTPLTFPSWVTVGEVSCVENPDNCCPRPPCGECTTTPSLMQVVATGFARTSAVVGTPLDPGCAWDTMNGTNLFQPSAIDACSWFGQTATTVDCPLAVSVDVTIGAGGQGQVTIYPHVGPGQPIVYEFTVASSDCCSTWTANLVVNYMDGLIVAPPTITVSGLCGGGGGGCTISRAQLGTATGTTTATLVGVTVVGGARLFVTEGSDGNGTSLTATSVTFAGAAMTAGLAATGNADTTARVWTLDVAATTTGDIVATYHTGSVGAFCAVEVLGIPAGSGSAAGASGTGTAPDTGSVSATGTCWYAQAAVCMKSVTGGAWSNGFTGGQSVTFTSGGHTYTVAEGYEVGTSAGTVEAKYTGASVQPSAWGAVELLYP